MWAIKWSSLGLLADTIHNLGDAATAVPLWIAVTLTKWVPRRRLTCGYGRVEDVAGVAVVLAIRFRALAAGDTSIQRLVEPNPPDYLGAVVWSWSLGKKEIGAAQT